MRDFTSAHGAKRGIFRQIKAFMERNRLGELLVLKGHITSKELRFALGEQKRGNQRLGEIFLKHAMISRRQLAWILMRQTALRVTAGVVMGILSLTSIANKRARADMLPLPPTHEGFILAGATSYGSLPGVFGTDEKRSTNLSAFTKWSGMFARYERQMSSSPEVMKTWNENLESLRGLPLKTMAAKVNNIMNEKPYIVDSKNWGQSDYWETPVEFMERGGDCEDFAISKYMALKQLGVPEERLRVAIVQDTFKNIPHAILIVYTDEGLYALDNQIKTLVDAEDAGRYKPIFSINRTAWWLHTTPDSTRIASR